MMAGMSEPAPRVALAEQAYATLKTELHDFRWLPGERASEHEIALRLGMSRTPVREALFRLRNEGFLEVEAKTGWTVKPIDFARIDQIYDLRIVLETASLARLGQLSDEPEQLQALKAVWLVPAAERLADGRAVGALDEQFHAQLVAAAGNDEISRVHREVTERIRIVRRLDFTRGDRIDATYAEHAKILRAVIQRKTEAAQLLLKSHIEQSKLEVRKITLHALQQARARRA
jgi:DNA-binding GntR family transcriptional regulator